jgi:hypothetical protein
MFKNNQYRNAIMRFSPLYNEKALIIGEHLIITDLHIGIEYELFEKGAKLPPQTKKMEERIARLLERSKPKKLVILGDLKHNIPKTSWQEYREIPQLVESLSRYAEVVVIKGNHDGNLEKLLPDTEIVKSLAIGDEALLFHGHTKLRKGEMNYNFIIMGHNHPCIEFKDRLEGRTKESAWIRIRFNERIKIWKNPEIIIMPAFNDLISGTPFNAVEQGALLGPFFKSGFMDLENAKVYLLDGTFLGRIKDI